MWEISWFYVESEEEISLQMKRRGLKNIERGLKKCH